MANHYIRQDLERRLILHCTTPGELVIFINLAVLEKLNNEEKKK